MRSAARAAQAVAARRDLVGARAGGGGGSPQVSGPLGLSAAAERASRRANVDTANAHPAISVIGVCVVGGERARWERQEGKEERERPFLTRGTRDVGCEVAVPQGPAAGVGVAMQRGRHLGQQAQEEEVRYGPR